MTDQRTDAALVDAFLAGDREAFAAVYDRFADPLHDTAAAMLRDRDDAADVTQDVFVIAAERMGQLRDRSRLKPWLFAILRNEVYRRTDRRARQRPTDFSAPGAPEVVAAGDPRAEAGAVETAELAADLREAARGLDTRDQLVLEMTVRQGLAGADLAAALGVSVEQSYVVVHRMRERVERSLGAFVVARAGRRDCPDLQAILRDWDGTFSVLVRKRVARHVDECPTCAESKRRYAAVPLLALAPALVAPAHLREDVLAAVGALGPPSGATVAPGGDVAEPVSVRTPVPYGFDAEDGFPTPLVTGRRRPALLLGAAAALIVLLVAGLVLVLGGDDTDGIAGPQEPPVAAAGPTEATTAPTDAPEVAPPPRPTTTARRPTTTPPGSTSSTSTSSTTTTTTSTTTTSTTIATAQPPPPPTTTTTMPPRPVTPTTVVFVAPTIATTTTAPPPPPPATTTTTAPPPRDRIAPVVSIVRAPGQLTCPWSAIALVAASVQDASPISSVTLTWSGPGPAGSSAMSPSGGPWVGRLDVAPVNGTWSWVVRAVETAGNAGTASGTTVVSGCR